MAFESNVHVLARPFEHRAAKAANGDIVVAHFRHGCLYSLERKSARSRDVLYFDATAAGHEKQVFVSKFPNGREYVEFFQNNMLAVAEVQSRDGETLSTLQPEKPAATQFYDKISKAHPNLLTLYP